jgi:hypothetical protein
MYVDDVPPLLPQRYSFIYQVSSRQSLFLSEPEFVLYGDGRICDAYSYDGRKTDMTTVPGIKRTPRSLSIRRWMS